jgi:hypothetical protein
MTSVFCDKAHSLAWQRILHARGLGRPHLAGRTRRAGLERNAAPCVLRRMRARRRAGLAPMGLRMVAPAIMAFGGPEQKARYLPRILSGENYWCQGYSEPGAGSDLASLRMQATTDGADYVLNGAKIWTTHAHLGDPHVLPGAHGFGGQAAGGDHLPADRDGSAGHQGRADRHPGRRARGQPGVLRRRPHAQGRPPGRRRTRAGPSPSTCWSSSAAAATRPGSPRDLDACGPARLRGRGREGRLLDDPHYRRRLAEAEIGPWPSTSPSAGCSAPWPPAANPGPASSILKLQGSEALQRLDELGVGRRAGRLFAPHQPQAREAGSNQPPSGPEHGLTTMARYT